MAVKIRLARHGSKKRPFYRIVAADSECRRDGRFIEILGTYNPLTDPADVDFKEKRVRYWMGEGAAPTHTVRNLLKRKGLLAKPA